MWCNCFIIYSNAYQSLIFDARSFLMVSTSFFSFSCLNLKISKTVISSWLSSACESLYRPDPWLPLFLLDICLGLGTFLAQFKACKKQQPHFSLIRTCSCVFDACNNYWTELLKRLFFQCAPWSKHILLLTFIKMFKQWLR